MKKLLSFVLILVLSLSLFVGCDEVVPSNDKTQAKQTEELQKQATSKLGLPNIKNFYEKETLKAIMEKCDDPKLITHTYTKNEMSGKLVYLGQSIGYGIPYGTQYTNPERIADWGTQSGYAILPQADPNGIYKAENVSATWVMLINPESKIAVPLYVESEIVVSPFKLNKRLCDEHSLPSDY
jgi:hypothetical protein